MRVNDLMTLAIERNASDLHLNPGRPPVVRLEGGLESIEEAALDEAASEASYLTKLIVAYRELKSRLDA